MKVLLEKRVEKRLEKVKVWQIYLQIYLADILGRYIKLETIPGGRLIFHERIHGRIRNIREGQHACRLSQRLVQRLL